MTKAPQWTTAQGKAIRTLDRNVYVAASAGTGKTAVLSERVVQAVVNQGMDVSRILVLTFTEAAAEEMRSRIGARLRAEIAGRRNAVLQQQLIRLDAAHISTIHAFCKRILDQYFYVIGLDPAYRILDEDEKKLLKSDCQRRVIEQAWQNIDFKANLEDLLTGRRITAQGRDFLATIQDVSNFLESLVDREAWLDQVNRRVMPDHFDDLLAETLPQVKQILAETQERFYFALNMDKQSTQGQYLSEQIQQDFLIQVKQWQQQIRNEGLKPWLEEFAGFEWNRLKNKPKDLDKSKTEPVKKIVKDAQGCIDPIRDWSLFSPAYPEQWATVAAQQSQTLVELVRRFNSTFTETKRQLNCLDFADLEHHMLRLLSSQPDIAEKLSQTFDLIFVDEYQDVNAVQQAILERIRRPDTFFAVGDVKQSIYAFRQSRPEIFLEQLGDTQQDLRVDLQENFRSRPEILNFVNQVFSRVMTDAIGGLAYDNRAALMPGIEYPPLTKVSQSGSAVEIVILDEQVPDEDEAEDDNTEKSNESEEQDALINAPQRQAAYIARRIRKMVGADTGRAEFQILDKASGTLRDVVYGDIVILMRSLSSRASQYVEMLRLGGIPVSSQTGSGYFDAMEIADVLCLLKVLDNPRRDIEFASVLRSAIFGVNDESLAQIRIVDTQLQPACAVSDAAGKSEKNRAYYESVLYASEHAEDRFLRKRLQGILSQLNQWRHMAQQGSMAHLLWDVYQSTGYLAYVTALPNGQQRKANLLKLHDRAIQFEGFADNTQLCSLPRFVAFVEELLEEGRDWAPAEPDHSTENAVRIMSVHRSKGLEFPVVFLAEMNRGFNHADSRGECVMHEQYGLGLHVIDSEHQVRINSAHYDVIREVQKQQDLAEEMRILYVAMTRARERLVLCASCKAKHCEERIMTGAMVEYGPLPGWLVKSAACPFDWVLQGLAQQTQLRTLFVSKATSNASHVEFNFQCLDLDRLNRMTREIMDLRKERCSPRQLPKQKPGDKVKALVRTWEQNLNWSYPFYVQTTMAAKRSVSDLSHQDDEFAQLDLSRAFEQRPAVCYTSSQSRTDHIDARDVGTGMHLILETLDLSVTPTKASIQQHVDHLVNTDNLSPNIVGHTEIRQILTFFASDIGQACLNPKNRVLREWPFTMRLPMPDSDPQDDDPQDNGFIIVQGIIDLLIRTPDGTIIIDFKTDHITPDQLSQRTQTYTQQLDLYGQAAKAILKQPIAGRWLYFFALNQAVEVS